LGKNIPVTAATLLNHNVLRGRHGGGALQKRSRRRWLRGVNDDWGFTPVRASFLALSIQVGDLGTIDVDAGLMPARWRWCLGPRGGWQFQEFSVIRRWLALSHG
jgi:hypothetical protein